MTLQTVVEFGTSAARLVLRLPLRHDLPGRGNVRSAAGIHAAIASTAITGTKTLLDENS